MAKGGSHLKQPDPAPRRPAGETQRSASRTERPTQEQRRSTPRTERPAQEQRRAAPRTERPTQEQRRSTLRTERPAQEQRRAAPRTERPVQEPRRAAPRTERPTQEQRRAAPRAERPTQEQRRSTPRPERPPQDQRRSTPRPDAPGRVAVQPPSAGRTPPRRRRQGFPLWPVIVLLALVIAFSLFMLAKTILSYTSNRADYRDIQDAAIIPRLPTTTAEPGETDTTETVKSSEIPFDVDWDMLRETNPDVIAWLYCPDTVINYPVVQTTDNEKYLTVNFSGRSNPGGALFADCNSVIGLRASHLIVYGHNMKDSSMFGTLKDFADEEYYHEHPVFYLLTPEQSYRVDLLDCLTIDATMDNYPTYFSESGSLDRYVSRITSGAYWVNSSAEYATHQLLTMSTCTSADTQRLILQGVLVPIE